MKGQSPRPVQRGPTRSMPSEAPTVPQLESETWAVSPVPEPFCSFFLSFDFDSLGPFPSPNHRSVLRICELGFVVFCSEIAHVSEFIRYLSFSDLSHGA